MATYTPHWYGNGLLNVFKGNIDMDVDTFKVTLHGSGYTPLQDTDDYYNDATNELSTANGYTSGGATLTVASLTYDTATHQVRWDVSDPSWTFTGAQTWRYAVLRKARGGASSADELLAYLDPGASVTASGSYSITINAAGLLYGVVS